MFLRTALLITALNAGLLPHIAAPMIAGSFVAAAVAAFLFLRARAEPGASALSVGSPDQLKTAFEFIAVVVVALLAGHYAQLYGGEFGMIASAIVAGGVDVDAATVSVSTIFAGATSGESVGAGAAVAMIAALSANSAVKVGIAYFRGSAALGWRAAIGLIGSALAAIIALVAQHLLGP